MFRKIHFLSVLALICYSNAVRVNLQGSLSIGKEVMDTISYYLNENPINGRRSMPFEDSDQAMIVKSEFICNDLDFCHGKLRKFLNQYIIVLAEAVEAIFGGILTVKNPNETKKRSGSNSFVFEEKLKAALRDIKRILKNSNDRITNNNKVYIWTDIVKRISGTFQQRTAILLSERLAGHAKGITEIKKKLTQRLVLAIVIIESNYLSKLCDEHNICVKSFECTKSLNTLLEQLKDLEQDRIKSFVRSFYETLPDTPFYHRLSEITANEFQIILNDMSYSDNVPSKELLSAVQKTVQTRLDLIDNNGNVPSGQDIQLVHVILSDMDHVYDKNKAASFNNFLNSFFEWTKHDRRMNVQIREVLRDITNQLANESEELMFKLIQEVRVFLELTVDPEK